MEVALMKVFKTTTSSVSPLDASGGTDPGQSVSDFLTVQSFTNFAAMTGGLTMAWKALQKLSGSPLPWVPYAMALVFGLCSVLMSLDGLKKDGKFDWGNVLAAVFVAFLNSLVLASAVVGAGGVVLSPS